MICTLKKCKGGKGNTVSNDGSTQIAVILTIKEMNYFVAGLFHDLVGFLSYLHLCHEVPRLRCLL